MSHNKTHLDDRGAKFMPTPDEIKRQCRAIQKRWDVETEQRRAGAGRTLAVKLGITHIDISRLTHKQFSYIPV